MAKHTIFGIDQKRVQPTFKMRSHAWLDTTTLKPKYSVQARDPEIENWAHIYNGETREILFFESAEAALEYIKQKRAQPRFPQTYCSQCGCELGAGNEGVSSCKDHK